MDRISGCFEWHRFCFSGQGEGMAMDRHWKLICKLKDVPLGGGVRLVPRGLAWQELPGVALYRSGEECVHAVLECDRARRYSVKVEGMKVYLDLEELSAPASKAEAALAGQLAWPPAGGVLLLLCPEHAQPDGSSAAGARRAAFFGGVPVDAAVGDRAAVDQLAQVGRDLLVAADDVRFDHHAHQRLVALPIWWMTSAITSGCSSGFL
jgi:nitrite reductase (NADH) small subunit